MGPGREVAENEGLRLERVGRGAERVREDGIGRTRREGVGGSGVGLHARAVGRNLEGEIRRRERGRLRAGRRRKAERQWEGQRGGAVAGAP